MRLVLIAVASLLSACAHTRTPPPAEARSEVNRRAEGRVVAVALRSGQRRAARAFRIDADSASWLVDRDGRAESVAASDVVSVTYNDVNRGALDGLLIGLAVGVAGGAAAHFSPEDPFLKPSLAWVAPLAFGVAGAGWGALGGTLKRAPVTYRLAR